VDKNERLERLRDAIRKNEKIGPKKVMISPTDYCNLKCKICWRLSKEEKYDELTLEQIDSLLKECKELGVKVIDFTGGGEPFLRKDIFEIMKLIKKYGLFGTLTTNGILLDEQKLKKIIELQLDDICFSLDGHTAEINDEIRGAGVFDKVIRSIKTLNELKKENSSEKPIVRIGTVITKKNYRDLDKIVELATELGVKAINFSVLIEWKTNEKFWLRDVNKNEIKKALEKTEQECKKLGVNSNISSIIKYGLFEHGLPKFCFAPWDMAFINASGDVMACCTLASLYENLLGNVKDSGFTKIWFGPKMKKFRDSIKKGNFHKECVKCIPEFMETYNKIHEKMGVNNRGI